MAASNTQAELKILTLAQIFNWPLGEGYRNVSMLKKIHIWLADRFHQPRVAIYILNTVYKSHMEKCVWRGGLEIIILKNKDLHIVYYEFRWVVLDFLYILKEEAIYFILYNIIINLITFCDFCGQVQSV